VFPAFSRFYKSPRHKAPLTACLVAHPKIAEARPKIHKPHCPTAHLFLARACMLDVARTAGVRFRPKPAETPGKHVCANVRGAVKSGQATASPPWASSIAYVRRATGRLAYGSTFWAVCRLGCAHTFGSPATCMQLTMPRHAPATPRCRKMQGVTPISLTHLGLASAWRGAWVQHPQKVQVRSARFYPMRRPQKQKGSFALHAAAFIYPHWGVRANSPYLVKLTQDAAAGGGIGPG
jgi:hypothetical protein